MSYKNLPDQQIRLLRPIDVQHYLLATGWERIPDIPGDIAVYRRSESDSDELIVPQNVELSDFVLRMTEVVSALSEYEARPPLQVINDLLFPSYDILRFRLADPSTEDGTVPLIEGINLLSGSKKALLASASSVIRPQKFHARMSRSEAENFINSCRLGQTEKGSFVASFICPLNAINIKSNDSQLALFADAEIPEQLFTRKVTTFFMKSIALIVKSINADQSEALLNLDTDGIQISANLCEALTEMQPPGERSHLSISTSWAPIVPQLKEVPGYVKIQKDLFPIIEQVGRALRPKAESKPELIIGKLDSLSGEPGIDEKMQGEVIIAFQAEEELIKARLELKPDDYAKACDAHKLGQYVRLSGILFRNGRMNFIHDYGNFDVMTLPSLELAHIA